MTPCTASRVRGSGRRRCAGARLLLVGDNTFEDSLGMIFTRFLYKGDMRIHAQGTDPSVAVGP